MAATITIETHTPDETAQLGQVIAELLRPGDILLLHGDLGAGKTTFTQGVASGLGVVDRAQSPTFTLVNEHGGQTETGEAVRLFHLDLYRLEGEGDLDSIGYGDLLEANPGIALIEWPERAGEWLPDAFLLVDFQIAGVDQRRIQLRSFPEHGRFGSLIDELAAAEFFLAPKETSS
jgi:tRNA threonylcarbamoyladenosine biosynthesis protein TsaE